MAPDIEAIRKRLAGRDEPPFVCGHDAPDDLQHGRYCLGCKVEAENDIRTLLSEIEARDAEIERLRKALDEVDWRDPLEGIR